MCASVYSSLFLYIFIIFTIISITMKMSTEGLPLDRQDRGFDDNQNNDDDDYDYDGGILAGEDFLSILMGSTFRRNYQEKTTTSSFLTTTSTESATDSGYNRETRSLPQQTEVNISLYSTTISDNNNNNNNSNNNNNNNKQYSENSSVDRTLIEEDNVSTTQSQDNEEDVTTATTSDELPGLVAESNKHNFGVEETEPITLKSDSIPIEFDTNNNNNNNDNNNNGNNNGEDYPARIQPLEPNQFHHHHHHQSTSSFITQEYENEKDKIHQTVIFHDDPNNSGRARSVSYSTVIQALPNTHFNKKQQEQQQLEEEEEEAQQLQSRHERHYNTNQSLFNRNFDGNAAKLENNTNYPRTTIATTLSTTTPTLTTTTTTTKRNWEHLPIIYNIPEQNYEIDESVSVMTNGRIHGIQTTPPPPPTATSTITQQQQLEEIKNNNNNRNVSNNNNNNNNKIGYVVQGRNYRKYRVEERTSDGFIVGEYGVVSNDDGTLRGVRYTADGTISRRLIQDALMKFLSL